jgi:hypothetical protein
MKGPYLFIFCFIFSVTICGCKKNAVEANTDLEGKWSTDIFGPYSGTILTINKIGNSSYSVQPCCGAGSEQAYSGKAKLDNDELKIGKKTVHVDAYPSYDATGNYRMILGGQNFYAVMAPVNPAANVTGTTATFSWSMPANFDAGLGQKKSLDYKIAAASAWTTIVIDNPGTQTNYILSGLDPATNYQWRMESINGTGTHSSQYSAVQNFTTQ